MTAHPGSTAIGAAALTAGYNVAFSVLAGIAAAGALLTAVMLESRPATAEDEAKVARAAVQPGPTV